MNGLDGDLQPIVRIIVAPLGSGIVRLPNYILQVVIYTIAHCDTRQIEFLSIDILK